MFDYCLHVYVFPTYPIISAHKVRLVPYRYKVGMSATLRLVPVIVSLVSPACTPIVGDTTASDITEIQHRQEHYECL